MMPTEGVLGKWSCLRLNLFIRWLLEIVHTPPVPKWGGCDRSVLRPNGP